MAPLEVTLRAIAPVDDGADAVETAERLLEAATLLPEVGIVGHSRSRQFSWRGQLSVATIRGGTVQLHGPNLFAKIDLAAVLAVSYCSDGTSSGIRLYDEGGALLTLCSPCRDTFDAWLGNTSPGYARDADRPRPPRLHRANDVQGVRTFPAP